MLTTNEMKTVEKLLAAPVTSKASAPGAAVDPIKVATDIKQKWPAIQLLVTGFLSLMFFIPKSTKDGINNWIAGFNILLGSNAEINFSKIKVKK